MSYMRITRNIKPILHEQVSALHQNERLFEQRISWNMLRKEAVRFRYSLRTAGPSPCGRVLCGEFVLLLTCCGSDVTSGPTAMAVTGNVFVFISYIFCSTFKYLIT